MEKRVGVGFPKLACEIQRSEDVLKCLKISRHLRMKMKSSGVRRSAEARNECAEKNWVETRHTKCMEDENKQKAEENPQKEEKEDSEHKRLQNIVKNLMPLPEQKKSAAKS